jgi:RHS repeat-associated protein
VLAALAVAVSMGAAGVGPSVPPAQEAVSLETQAGHLGTQKTGTLATRAAGGVGGQKAGGLEAQPSANGSFTHAIPIQVPAFHGIQPSVSLGYDSSAGNGEVGVGWRLSVGSRIVRGGASGGLPRFDSSDVYLLDGAELVACAPHCGTGGTHETRRKTFERISFDGTGWTRWQRDGVKLTYESPTAPTTATEWSLASVVDTHGNTVTYDQDCPGHCYPDRITYGAATVGCGKPGQAPCKAGAEVRFFWELRTDIATYPTGGTTQQIRQRLRTVHVRMDGHTVAAYALAYATSALTGDSVLRSVQQFAGDALVAADGKVTAGSTPPLPPITFAAASMSAPAAKWTAEGTAAVPLTIGSPPGNAAFSLVETSVPGNRGACRKDDCEGDPLGSPLYGDFDGDRRLDVTSWRVGSTCGRLTVRLGMTGTPVNTDLGRTPSHCPQTGYVTDLNGDGSDDMVLMTDVGTVARAVSRRDGHFTVETADHGTPWQLPWQNKPVTPERQCAATDLDGDGLGDLVCVWAKTTPAGSVPRIGTLRSTPDGGWIATETALPASVPDLEGVLLTTGDMDASGTGDVMLVGWLNPVRFIGRPMEGKVSLVTGFSAPDGSIASWITTSTDWTRANTPEWNLSAADVDGDGRSDYALVQDGCCDGQSPAGGAQVHVATAENAGRALAVVKPVVSASGDHAALGDADGDGRDDILTGNPPAILHAAGDGAFAAPKPIPSATGSASTCDGPEEVFSAVDQNGDGQADLICQTHGLNAQKGPIFTLWAQPSPVAPPPATRWRSFDGNGDGRTDLYAVRFRNWGYQVYIRTAQADGSYASSSQEIASLVSPPWLTEPDTSRWVAADVGGPDGHPDGRSDLLLVGRDRNCVCPNSFLTLAVTTLLSTDHGFELRYDQPWHAVGPAAFYAAADTQTWRPAELNGDGRADLVHFSPLEPGVRVEYLLANGDGTWTMGHTDRFTNPAAPGGALARSDVKSFRVADLNRDGLSDFVHVEVGGGPTSNYRTIRSLVSTGPTVWDEQSDRSFQPIPSAAAHDLEMVDFDGDGVPDLGRAVVDGGCVRVQAFLRAGDGWSTMRLGGSSSTPPTVGAPPPCVAAAGLDDRRDLVLADVNADGRTDVYRLIRVGAGANAANDVSTLINTGDPVRPLTWRWVDQPGIAVPDPDAWAWTNMDTDHDGIGELVHPGGSIPDALRRLRWGGGDDRLTRIDNGRGATTQISYRAQAGARDYLPASMLPIVVDRVAVTDTAHDPPVVAAASFTYGGARWSERYHRLLGFASLRSEQGASAVAVGNELSDACGPRVSSTAFEATAGGTIAGTATEFADAGNSAPFTCLPKRTVEKECELTDHCLEKATEYAYDDYGNAERVEESGGSLRRRTDTPVHPDTADWIVDRPWKSEVLVPDPSTGPDAWRPVSRTLFGYDNETFEQPPHQQGDLTRVTAFWDLDHDLAAETYYEYDAAGNRTSVTDPVGVVSHINYDPDRALHPISVCDMVGCTKVTWNETLGLPREVTDANGGSTTTEYDAFGRPSLVTGPDHATTATSYPDVGVVLGPDQARQRVRTEESDGSAGDGVHWHEDLLDGLGRIYRSLDEGANTARDDVLVVDGRYDDASARRSAVSLPHRAADPARWTTFAYDGAHRLTKVEHPGGAGALTRAFSVGTIEDTDELGHFTTTHHDAFGRIAEVDEHVQLCPGCNLDTLDTHYSYDALDHPVSILDTAGQLTTVTRDDLGRETTVTDPDRGKRTRTWRADGSLDVETDANGVRAWTYDAVGRPSTRTDTGPTGAAKARWDYDRDPATKQTQGDSIGQVTLVTYSSSGTSGAVGGSERTWYDEAGRATLVRSCVGAACDDLGFGYDPAGRLSNLHYPDLVDPDGENVPYRYNAAGRLLSVGGYLTGIEYDAAGHPVSHTYGNGLIEQLSYDPDREWLDSQTLASTPTPTHPLYAATYTHDLTGHVTDTTTLNQSGPNPQPVMETFGYDELDRLTSYTTSNRPSLLPERYQYDELGRMTKSPQGGVHHYDDPTHPHAVTSTSAGHQRAYDTAGNLEALSDPSGRTLKLTWTPTGMPASIANGHGETTMAYDPAGERVQWTRTGGPPTSFFGRYLEREGTKLTRYYWAGDQLIARRDPKGSVSYLLSDRLHSTRVVTGQGQSVTARYDYEPYGTQRSGGQVDTTAQRWQGQRADPDDGLVDLHARFYDPELGQFTAPDSLIPDMYRPKSLNRYAFAGNDPVNRWDPGGHADSAVEKKTMVMDPLYITGTVADDGTPELSPSRLTEESDPTPDPEPVTPEPVTEGSVTAGTLTPPPLIDADTGPNHLGPESLSLLSSQVARAAPRSTDLTHSNMGGTCSACHDRSYATRLPTRGERVAFIVVGGAALVVIGVLATPATLVAAAGTAGGLGGVSGWGAGVGIMTLAGAGTSVGAIQVEVVVAGTAVVGVGAAAMATSGGGSEEGGSVDSILSGLRAGQNKPNLEVDDVEQLESVFERLSAGGKPVQSSYPGKFVELADGTRIGLRNSSRSGGATIDVFKPDGTYIKVHLP